MLKRKFAICMACLCTLPDCSINPPSNLVVGFPHHWHVACCYLLRVYKYPFFLARDQTVECLGRVMSNRKCARQRINRKVQSAALKVDGCWGAPFSSVGREDGEGALPISLNPDERERRRKDGKREKKKRKSHVVSIFVQHASSMAFGSPEVCF